MGAAVALPTRLLPTGSLLAASAAEQVNLGIVGCGWRGGDLRKIFEKLPGVKIAGLCDVDRELVDKLGQESPQAKRWTDLRQMFDSPDIDAVAIATCNHWHCLAAIWAMQAGKHVYVEKPLGHTQWEGEQVINASANYQRICQVGTQQRSDPMQAEIKHFLHEDKAIGDLESVRVNRFGVRESIGRRAQPLVPPSSVDYNLWLGPAQEMPIFRDKLHYDWHWDWNTGSGEMGNWGVHVLDDVRNNVFLDSIAAPNSITAAGGRFAWNDAGNTPNVHFAVLDAGGIPVVVTLSNLPIDQLPSITARPKSGYIAYCSEGRLEGQRGKAAAFDVDGKLIKKFKGDGGNGHHQQNFIDAVRDNKPELLVAPAQVGHDTTTWCNLINIASRVPHSSGEAADSILAPAIGTESAATIFEQIGTIVTANAAANAVEQLQLGPTLHYDTGHGDTGHGDTAHGRFVGRQSDYANRLLRRNYRTPFDVPEV